MANSYGIPDDKHALERERAMLETLHRIRVESRRYARLHQEAHPEATQGQCYRPAVFAALHSADREHTFWDILTEKARRIHDLLRTAQ